MILVDNQGHDHEEIAPLMAHLTDAKVKVQRLKFGDFAFEGNGPEGEVLISIERKKIGDMAGSMRSDRLAGAQVPRMAASDISYLLIEGLYRPGRDGMLQVFNPASKSHDKWGALNLANTHQRRRGDRRTFRYSYMDKHVVSLETRKGMAVIRSGSEWETANQIVNRYNWWSEPWDSHRSTDPLKYQAAITFSRITAARDVASRIPGVGWERSRIIAKAFGTVEEMVLAELWDWTELVGEALGEKAYKWLRSRS